MDLLTQNYRRPEQAAAAPQREISSALRYRQHLARLEASQWWDRGRLRDFQFALLKPMLRHAYETVPYYRQRFDQAGLRPEQIGPDTWLNVPILTRDALQVESLLSRCPPKAHGQLLATETSGATGQPVRVVSTDRSQFFFRLLGLRDHLWQRRDTTLRHASIRHFPGKVIPAEGLSAPQWCDITGQLFGRGPLNSLSILNPIDRQLEWLKGQNPAYLLTYPSNLKALIEGSGAAGIVFPELREVRTISETVTPELRSLCRERWGAKLVDTYSCQEFGYLALQCPEHEHYHIQAEGVLLEILDDAGQPCRPGEIGRVVVTSLHNYAMPLIRYQIRDYAEAGAPCPCGRGLPVVNRVFGRQRNMLTLPSGQKKWPVFSWPRYREVAAIRQFQFIQHSLEQIEMRLVADQVLSDEQKQRLTAIIHESLGYPFEIVMTAMDCIPQGKNGKFEEFISHVSGASDSGRQTSHPAT